MGETVSMPVMFRACNEVLDETLKPIHYAELTQLAVNKLGIKPSDLDWERQKEDVREKMLLSGKFNAGYTGKPQCLAFKKDWFPGSQMRLLNTPDDYVSIPGNIRSGIRGAYEALMRMPYMVTKYTTATPERRFLSGAKGLVIEAHVTDWFKKNWPRFYREPDNYEQWERPCYHDFKLDIGKRVLLVDISGEKLNGQYGNPGGGKMPVDLHLLCSVDEGANKVIWKGFVRGEKYTAGIFPSLATTPTRLVVWLNCLHDSIDYGLFSSLPTHPTGKNGSRSIQIERSKQGR